MGNVFMAIVLSLVAGALFYLFQFAMSQQPGGRFEVIKTIGFYIKVAFISVVAITFFAIITVIYVIFKLGDLVLKFKWR